MDHTALSRLTGRELLLDSDRAATQAREADRKRIEREAAQRATHYEPRPCGADFATGLVLGALIF